MCQQSNIMKDNKPKILPLVRLWGNLYATLPKVYIPNTNFAIGLTLYSAFFFSSLRFFYDYVYVTILEFPSEHPKTKYMAACTVSLTHSLLLVPALWQVLRSQPYKPSAKIDGTPLYYQNAVTALLQLCTGYMLYDPIFIIKDNSWSVHSDDVPFLLHHLVTIIYMSQVRILGAGHISAMTMMFSGEVTNPFQSTDSVVRFAIQLAKPGSVWHVIHPYVEYVFAFSYAFVRSIVGPLQILHIAYDLLLTREGRSNVKPYISVVWIILLSAIIVGSIPWIEDCVEMVRDGVEVVKYDSSYDYGPKFEL